MAKWIFDMPSGSGATVGGSLVEKAIEDSDEIDGIFARESGSNSGDQVLNAQLPVSLYYDVIEISGKEKKRFLDSLDWKNLKKHVDASIQASNDNSFQDRLGEGIDHIKGNKLICVKVSDSNATGLLGDEDDTNSNFHLFCKAQLESSDDGKRQGSFGLGKAVHWGWSQIATVIMSSSVPKKTGGKLSTRIFGRSELRSHSCPVESWNSSNSWLKDGFFGSEATRDHLYYSKSIWDDSNLAKDLFLDRTEFGQGTSILTIAYNDRKKDSNESPKEILDGLEENIKTWFWPAIHKKSLEIRIRHFKNSKKVSDKLVDTEGWNDFVDAQNNSATVKLLENVGEFAEAVIPINIPKKKNETDDGFEGEVKLRVTKGIDENTKKDHIALLRKNLCVVRYEKIRNDLENPIFGVLLAGTAHPGGETNENLRVHDFLRDAEPPLHNNWKYYQKLKGIYEVPFQAEHNKFLGKILTEAQKLITPKVDTQNADLSHLSKKFKFGSADEKDNPKARSMKITHHAFTTNKHIIRGTVINLKTPNAPWTTTMQCKYVAIGGKIPLEVKVKTVSAGSQVMSSNLAVVRSDVTVDTFDFELEALCSPLFTNDENEQLDIELLEIPKEI
tara:strand:+ start:2944 stop:4788 length:1845 start_codon:yes stop_codon:yes gene_type:complete